MSDAFKTPFSKRLGFALTVISLAFHLVVFYLYKRQPDTCAAFTVYPIWIWGLVGISISAGAFIFLRAPGSLIATGVWLLTILFTSDEAYSLSRFGQKPITPQLEKKYQGQKVLRVITANLSSSNQESAIKQISLYKPDVVFLQEIPHPYQVKQMAVALFGNSQYRYDDTRLCAILTKGNITDHRVSPHYRSILTTVQFSNGHQVELLNLHLQSAATDLRLWKRECWQNHKINRKMRRQELYSALLNIRENSNFPRIPAIIAGDFNAAANDRLYRMMEPHFFDTFRESGTGWGNTYHRRLPLLRIDKIYASEEHFIPVRSRAVSIPHSDHRMVISDLIYR